MGFAHADQFNTDHVHHLSCFESVTFLSLTGENHGKLLCEQQGADERRS
jgi:hypothetical protein